MRFKRGDRVILDKRVGTVTHAYVNAGGSNRVLVSWDDNPKFEEDYSEYTVGRLRFTVFSWTFAVEEPRWRLIRHNGIISVNRYMGANLALADMTSDYIGAVCIEPMKNPDGSVRIVTEDK